MSGPARKNHGAAWLTLLLAIFCFIAAVYLIEVRFEARKLQATLDEVEKLKTGLREQNRRYLIELTSFSDYSELRRRAFDEQEMFFPDYGQGTFVDLRKMRASSPKDPDAELAN